VDIVCFLANSGTTCPFKTEQTASGSVSVRRPADGHGLVIIDTAMRDLLVR